MYGILFENSGNIHPILKNDVLNHLGSFMESIVEIEFNEKFNDYEILEKYEFNLELLKKFPDYDIEKVFALACFKKNNEVVEYLYNELYCKGYSVEKFSHLITLYSFNKEIFFSIYDEMDIKTSSYIVYELINNSIVYRKNTTYEIINNFPEMTFEEKQKNNLLVNSLTKDFNLFKYLIEVYNFDVGFNVAKRLQTKFHVIKDFINEDVLEKLLWYSYEENFDILFKKVTNEMTTENKEKAAKKEFENFYDMKYHFYKKIAEQEENF